MATMRLEEQRRARALWYAWAAVLGLGAAGCLGPGLEPPGGDEIARAGAAGTSAPGGMTATTGEGAKNPSSQDASRPTGTSMPPAQPVTPPAPVTTPPAAMPGAMAPSSAAGSAAPGAFAGGGGSAATAGAPARDEDAGVE